MQKLKSYTMSQSNSPRENLKRIKLDHTERKRTDYFKTDALHSHERPHDVVVELRRADRVAGRALTEPLDDIDNS